MTTKCKTDPLPSGRRLRGGADEIRLSFAAGLVLGAVDAGLPAVARGAGVAWRAASARGEVRLRLRVDADDLVILDYADRVIEPVERRFRLAPLAGTATLSIGADDCLFLTGGGTESFAVACLTAAAVRERHHNEYGATLSYQREQGFQAVIVAVRAPGLAAARRRLRAALMTGAS